MKKRLSYIWVTITVVNAISMAFKKGLFIKTLQPGAGWVELVGSEGPPPCAIDVTNLNVCTSQPWQKEVWGLLYTIFLASR